MIETKHLYAGYDDDAVLEDIDLQFAPGTLSVILGPNGCGKSTLLRTLLGILPALSGSVEIDGKNVQQMSSSERAERMSAVMQMNSIPNMSVFQYVLHGRFHSLSWPRRYKAHDLDLAHKALEKMGIAHLENESMAEISGGERQKAALAQALCQDAPILFLDEPGTWLDAASQFELYRLAKRMSLEGKTVMMISHDLPSALEYADRVIVLDQKHKVFDGLSDTLVHSGLIESVFHVEIAQCAHKGKTHYFYAQ